MGHSVGMDTMTVARSSRIIQTAAVPAAVDPVTDVDVLRRVAGGEKAALAELYDRHSGMMLALGVRIVGVRRDAEDILHDVFIEAWRHAGDYDPRRGSVKTWLLLRMRSRCLDRVRSHAFSKTDAFTTEPMRSGQSERLDRGIDGARARSLLDTLPQGQREVLELGYLQGLSFSEIADVLGIPVGTVKSRVSAAMLKLREDLGVKKEAS